MLACVRVLLGREGGVKGESWLPVQINNILITTAIASTSQTLRVKVRWTACWSHILLRSGS